MHHSMAYIASLDDQAVVTPIVICLLRYHTFTNKRFFPDLVEPIVPCALIAVTWDQRSIDISFT